MEQKTPKPLQQRWTTLLATLMATIAGATAHSGGAFGSDGELSVYHVIVIGISMASTIAGYAFEGWRDSRVAVAIAKATADGTVTRDEGKQVIGAAVDDIADLFSDPDTVPQKPEEGGAP